MEGTFSAGIKHEHRCKGARFLRMSQEWEVILLAGKKRK